MDTLLLGASNNKVNMLQEKPVSPIRAASPPSASSSPSHEFSFAISSDSTSSSLVPYHNNKTNINININTKAKSSSSPSSNLAIDLSPADDIFFHGHLLPLQFLSHLPVSPRSSTNSLDSFTLPIRDFVVDEDRQEPIFNAESNDLCTSSIDKKQSNIPDSKNTNSETKGRTKSKSFSIFGLPKRRKESEDDDQKQQQKSKMRFDVSNILKRYVRMIRPLLFSRGRKDQKNNVHFSRQPYSFSGNLSPKNRHHLHHFRGIRGEFSAPTSMRTSPTNSSILLATSGASTPPTNSTNDSTMEELHAAIQAAIAHCKNSSIATEEKTKCLE